VTAPCSIRVASANGATLARATRALTANVISIVRARATRRRLGRARKLRATMIATTPGATPIRRRVLLRR
jgi:hypothetical protein